MPLLVKNNFFSLTLFQCRFYKNIDASKIDCTKKFINFYYPKIGVRHSNGPLTCIIVLVYSAHRRTRKTHTKEYISVIEGTAPPCVFQTFAHPTSPCSVCSTLQLPDCLTEQAGGEVG